MNKIAIWDGWNVKYRRVSDVSPYVGIGSVAINPLTATLDKRKVLHHHRKVVNGELVEMSDEEKARSSAYHDKAQHKNPDIVEVKVFVPGPERIVTVKDIEYQDRVEVVFRTPRWVVLSHGVLIGFIAVAVYLLANGGS